MNHIESIKSLAAGHAGELIQGVGAITGTIKASMHDLQLVGGFVGLSVMQSFLEPYEAATHPDLTVERLGDRSVRIIETLGQKDAWSIGSTFIPGIEPIIYMRPGLREANEDVYNFFLRREIYQIESTRALAQPIIFVISNVALACLVPTAWPFWGVALTWMTVNTIVTGLVLGYYENRAEDWAIACATQRGKKSIHAFLRFLEENKMNTPYLRLEKKLAGSSQRVTPLMQIKFSKYIQMKEQRPVIVREECVRPSRKSLRDQSSFIREKFELRAEKFYEIKKNDYLSWVLPHLPNTVILLVAGAALPIWLLLLLNPVTMCLSKRIIKPIEDRRLRRQVNQIDRELTKINPRFSSTIKGWLKYKKNPRLKQIIPASKKLDKVY